MKIGRKTQAYGVGFLIGVAMVSILIDSRRERAIEKTKPVFEWVASSTTPESLPGELVAKTKARGYVTLVEQKDADGNLTGAKGYFFANDQGQKFWYYGDSNLMEIYDGSKLTAVSWPGLEFELMKSGFEHQNHRVLSGPDDIPNYLLEIDAHSAQTMIDAVENLRSKENFIAEVGWKKLDVVTDAGAQE